MFKRLKDLLFNEEEYVEEEEVDVEAVKIADSIHKTNPKQAPRTTKITPVEPTIKDEPEESKPQPKVSTLKPLTIDDDTPKETKAVLNNEPAREYEFSPVISPFFGVQGEEVARVPVKKKEVKREKGSNLDTIISPFYGRINHIDEEHNTIEESSETLINDSLTLEEILCQTEDDADAVQVSLFDSNDDNH